MKNINVNLLFEMILNYGTEKTMIDIKHTGGAIHESPIRAYDL
jgi:hypothetical protein